MARRPVVAGQFYEAGLRELNEQIRESFMGRLGPGSMPGKRTGKRIGAIISPHAGYFFSGQCAAWGFREVAEAEFPDIFILLGISHRGYDTCISFEDWATPFGTVKNDHETGNLIADILGIDWNENAHAEEHSIEVQLPFLQFCCKDREKDIRIIPIMVSGEIDPEVLAKGISKALKKQGKSAVFIASSDFTHYGPNYNYTPFNENVKQRLYELDRGAIELILKADSKGFQEYVKKSGATICGRNAIAAVLECAGGGASMLKYYTSSDVYGNYTNAVGYASIVFRDGSG